MRRGFLLVFLLYLAADYCDPGIPGVFFFGTEAFFVDAAIQQRSAPIRPGPVVHHLAVLGDAPEARSEAYEAARPVCRARSVAFVPPRPTTRDGYLPVKTPAEDS
jgi:hypothetical protein